MAGMSMSSSGGGGSGLLGLLDDAFGTWEYETMGPERGRRMPSGRKAAAAEMLFRQHSDLDLEERRNRLKMIQAALQSLGLDNQLKRQLQFGAATPVTPAPRAEIPTAFQAQPQPAANMRR